MGNRASAIAGTLLIAYLIFVVYKGRLPYWLAILGITSQSGINPTSCSTATSQQLGQAVGNALGAASNLLGSTGVGLNSGNTQGTTLSLT